VRLRALPLAILLLLALVAPAEATEPWFLASPTDQMAVAGHEAGTEITPEGYLYTGSTELVFFHGSRLRPLDQPRRTLSRGREPVFAWSRRADGVEYRLQTFAAPVEGRAVNWVRVELRAGRRPARARFAAGVRHRGAPLEASGAPRFRFRRPAVAPRLGLYSQPGEPFDPAASYAWEGRALVRDGRALYLAPRPGRGVRLTLTSRPDPGAPARPGTLWGRADYRVRLRPRERRVLDLRMPVVPEPPGTPAWSALARLPLPAARARAERGWRALLRPAVRLELPERKVEDAFYASLLTLALARYREPAGRWVQPVNKLQYHAFYLRDAAVITQAYDLAGLHRLAGENLGFFFDWQRPDGLFISRPGQHDGHGQALWAIGQHARRTGDRAFAERAFPAVARAMDWLTAARRADRLGLVPASDPRDNELVAGRLTGDAFWALAGAAEAVALARMLGRQSEADSWGAQREKLRAAVDRALPAGPIPPSFDAPGGQDWGNLWAAWPGPALAPDDPRVTATLRHARAEFREGLATYLDGRVLHHYLGFRVLQTELLRGEREPVVQGLYDALAHTTATHGGWELGLHPHGSRSVDDNMAPHGWWAAEYVALLRAMLVREEGTGLVLGSALPPAWLATGRRVRVLGAPTLHGRVSFALRAGRRGAVLSWRAPRGVPVRLVVPAGARRVAAPGLDREGGSIRLPPTGRGGVRLRWRLERDRPTYAGTERALRAAYARSRAGADR
jgi:hypothetical protein